MIIVFRLCLPETDAYKERQAMREATPNAAKVFVDEGKVALKKHWLLLVYMVLLMAGFNFMVCGSVSNWGILDCADFNFLVPWISGSVSDHVNESV